MRFEPVHAVWDYSNGPRTGLADYKGAPHYFACLWDDEEHVYSSSFSLTPVDEDTFRIAVLQWDILRRWQVAFRSGEVTTETHPSHGGVDPRYDELTADLKARLARAERLPLRVLANFRVVRAPSDAPADAGSQDRTLEVEWLPVG
jgi:hypothetical protein